MNRVADAVAKIVGIIFAIAGVVIIIRVFPAVESVVYWLGEGDEGKAFIQALIAFFVWVIGVSLSLIGIGCIGAGRRKDDDE